MAHALTADSSSGAVIAAPLMQTVLASLMPTVLASTQLASTRQERNAGEFCAPGGRWEVRGKPSASSMAAGSKCPVFMCVSRHPLHPLVTITV